MQLWRKIYARIALTACYRARHISAAHRSSQVKSGMKAGKLQHRQKCSTYLQHTVLLNVYFLKNMSCLLVGRAGVLLEEGRDSRVLEMLG